MEFGTRIDDYCQTIHAPDATEAAVKAIRRWRQHGYRWIGDRRETIEVHVIPIDGLGRPEEKHVIELARG